MNKHAQEEIIISQKENSNIIMGNFDFRDFNDTKKLLKENSAYKVVAVVKLDESDQKILSAIYPQCIDEIAKKAITRRYLATKIFSSITEQYDLSISGIDRNNIQISSKVFYNANFKEIISNQKAIPDIYDLEKLENKLKQIKSRLELNFFEQNITNKYLQTLVNDLIASFPLSTKRFFTDGKTICHHCTSSSGNFIQPIHDYRPIDYQEEKDFSM